MGHPGKGYSAYYDTSKRRDNEGGNAHLRKRIKSEAPLGQQLRTATPSDPDHRRRIRALQGLPPEDGDEQDGDNMSPQTTQKKSHKASQGNVMDDATREGNSGRGRPTVPDMSDILNNFKPPEGPRVFKSEPIDNDVWESMLADKEKAKKKSKKDKRNIAEQSATPAREMSSETPEVSAHRRARAGLNTRRSAQPVSSDFVDLTEETPSEGGSVPPPAIQAPTQGPTSNLPRPLTTAQIQIMDQIDVPQGILQQAIDIYRRESTAMPTNVKKWAQLKNFVAQHPASFISPQLCLIAQAHAFHAASAPSLPRPPPPPSTSTPVVSNNANARTPTQPRAARATSMNRYAARETRASPETPRIKTEPEETSQPQHQPEADIRRPRDVHPNPPVQTTSNKTPRIPTPPTQSAAHTPHELANQPTDTHTTTTQIQKLLQPSNLMPDILPPDAPHGHPHLVQLWHPTLLSLPIEQHDHLNIQDTVMSILAKYDLKTKSVISAFLDTKKVNHFFFLFKAREGNLHSWSVEREEDVITVSTSSHVLQSCAYPPAIPIHHRPSFFVLVQSLTSQIGIERPTRAPNLNTTDQSRPSSGQYDLTIQYRMPPPISISPPETTAPAPGPFRIDPDNITPADLDRHLASQAQPQNTLKYPAPWTLIHTSIFPSSPDLFTFLHHTPPTRGADEHELFTHPRQTSQLPGGYLSMFARYMAQTAFGSTIMDAEVQVAFGRKVRYDSVLGRVRALWDYALKGAKTQRAKRERGEYNRPTKGGSSGGAGVGRGHSHGSKEVPGYGVSGEFLAGGVPGAGSGEDGRGASTLVGEVGEEVGGEEGEDEERMRKRVKRERMRERERGRGDGESGSEYYDGSGSE
ncbi:hypothetical protein OHC33_004637 [Knufia fluminis]|uniref:Uncharacterized protein n=1 Tax=Knufia fluminis TaxID=191047 RepID=A0AAN8I844_9EURO|nr:hypothetical protein OHC33_004637 [Knufia fluminis]